MQPRRKAGAPDSRGGQFAAQVPADSGIVQLDEPAWPAVAYLDAHWTPSDPMMSHRQRLANSGAFRYAIPALISQLDPVVSDDLLASADEVCGEMAAFDAESAGTWAANCPPLLSGAPALRRGCMANSLR